MPEITPSRAHREFWHRPDRAKCCIACGDEKPLSEFYAYGYTTRQGKRGTRYESRCKPCARARRLKAYAGNHSDELMRMAAWRAERPDKVIAQRRAYQASDHGKRVKARNQRARHARTRASVSGPEKAEIREVYAEAMELETLFGVKFHVDHITPLSKGGKHERGNLQVLLACDNLKKGARLPSPRCHGDRDA